MPKQKIGTVYLVGAGPGDPRLLTLRAIELLKKADVVLYDYLVHPNCLHYVGEKLELICVGKRKGAHSATQKEINKKMISLAKKGKTIVRLKGGDPMIFGRAGEEMEQLNAHKIPYEIVPGISSASAVPAYAGIPLTHRDHARSVAFVTGTLKTGDGVEDIHIPHAETIVFLMSVTHLEWIVKRLTESQRFKKSTPAALIYKGTTSDQKKVVGTLSNIVKLRDTHQMSHPSILVVGKVAGLSKKLDWHSLLPLFGKRVISLRTLHQSEKITEKLTSLGADVIQLPLLKFNPILSEEQKISRRFLTPFTTLIFTSANGVSHFMNALLKKNCDVRAFAGKKIICVGPKTAEKCAAYGILADAVPETFSQEGILGLFGDDLVQENILIPTAKGARDFLENNLKKRGAQVQSLHLYETVCPEIPSDHPVTVQDGDYVLFTSGSTARHFFESSFYEKQDIVSVCIGEETMKAVRGYRRRKVFLAEDGDFLEVLKKV